MANKRPLIITGAQVGNLEIGDALVNPVGVAYATAFTTLSDAPSTYTGQAGKFLRVNLTATGLEFTAGGGGGGSLPLDEIGFGTGSSITSSPDLTYNPISGQLSLQPTPKEVPDVTTIKGADSLPFSTAGVMQALFNIPTTQGYLAFTLNAPLTTGAELTGLVGATTYTATITVDGTPYPISVLGSDAPDFNSLAGQISPQLGGGAAGFAYSDTPPPFNYLFAGSGEFRIASNSFGATSIVTYVDTGPNPLFGSLLGNPVVSSVSVPGIDEVTTFPPTTPTGLTPATLYSETITVDGTPHIVSFLGSAAQTIATLTAQLSSQLATFATAAYDGINTISVTSLTLGPTSTVISPQTGFLQVPGPIANLVNVSFAAGQNLVSAAGGVTIQGGAGTNTAGSITLAAGVGTGSPSGSIIMTTNNRILENHTEIYELVGADGTNLKTADGQEIPIPSSIGPCGGGVFEMIALGQDGNAPPNVTALTIRGGYVDIVANSTKETYVDGGGTIDVVHAGSFLRVTASGSPGMNWIVRVKIIQLSGGCPI